MKEVTAAFVDGFVGAFKVAAALAVGISSGIYTLFSRLGGQYARHERLH